MKTSQELTDIRSEILTIMRRYKHSRHLRMVAELLEKEIAISVFEEEFAEPPPNGEANQTPR